MSTPQDLFGALKPKVRLGIQDSIGAFNRAQTHHDTASKDAQNRITSILSKSMMIVAVIIAVLFTWNTTGKKRRPLLCTLIALVTLMCTFLVVEANVASSFLILKNSVFELIRALEKSGQAVRDELLDLMQNMQTELLQLHAQRPA